METTETLLEADFLPSADFCVGRRALCDRIVKKAFASGFCLFFGGRKSGKRTVLRWLSEKWSTAYAESDKPSVVQIAVLLDTTQAPRFADEEQLFAYALNACRKSAAERIRGLRLPDPSPQQALQTSADWLFSEIDKIAQAAPSLTFRLLLAIHRPELILDWGIDSQIFQNVNANVRYGTRPQNNRVGVVYAGGSQLFCICENRGSPFHTIAEREYAVNISREAVEEMLDICGCRLSKTKAAVVAGLVHRATGGQAYLSRQLCAFLARVSPNTLGPAVVERIADTIARQNRDQFDLWPTELSEPAMVAFALLRKQSSVAKRDLTTALEERELQPTLARRAALQCAFSGIAEYDSDKEVLVRSNQLFWRTADSVKSCSAKPKLANGAGAPATRPPANSPGCTRGPKLVVHKSQCMIEVNGAKVTNLSVSQYALLRTMAEKFTLSNSQSVKQREVLEQTALLLTVLVAERPEWFNDAERKAWSKQAKANTLEKSGENRQLWTEVKGKLWSTPNASPLLSVLPDRGTRGGFKLQIQSSQVGFRS